MSQRRPQLKVVVSNRSGIKNCFPLQRKLPIGFSDSLPSTELSKQIDRLRQLRPAYVNALERLVKRALDELERAG